MKTYTVYGRRITTACQTGMIMYKDKLFPATVMPDQDWWHALWPNPSQVLRDAGIVDVGPYHYAIVFTKV